MAPTRSSSCKARIGSLAAVCAATVLACVAAPSATQAVQTPRLQAAPVLNAAPRTPVSVGFAGDLGHWQKTTAVLKAVAQTKPQAFYALGDFSYSDPNVFSEQQWCTYMKDTLNAGAGLPAKSEFGEKFPVALLSGNHESGGPGAQPNGLIDKYTANTCLPNRLPSTLSPHKGTNNDAPDGNYGKEYFTDFPATAPLMRVLTISPQLNFLHGGAFTYTKGSPRYQWVSDTIDQARAAGIPWIVVGMHHSYISPGSQRDSTGTDIMNLLLEKKVDLILHGHDHVYGRSKQLRNGTAECPRVVSGQAVNQACVVDDGSDNAYNQNAGSVMTLVGTGGAVLYPVDGADPDMGYFAKAMLSPGGNADSAGVWGFLNVTASETSLKASFVKGAGTAAFSDSFSINRTVAPPPPPVQQIVTVTPSADTTVKQLSPRTNFGRESSTKVDGNPREDVLMKFPLAAVAGKKIVGAKLRLYVVNPSIDAGAVSRTSSTWSESTVTYANAPAVVGAPLGRVGAASTASTWREISLSPQALANLNEVSLRIISTNSDGAGFSSRETTRKPQLVLTVQ